MKRHHFALSTCAIATLLALAIGCHADANDPAGQAGELSDAVRRENAIANLHRLYTDALSRADGDRSAAGPRAVADASVQQLTSTYVEHPEDMQNGLRILDLLVEMRDPRSLPALTKALDWRPEVTEEHAIRSARVLQQIELDDAQKGEVVAAISRALEQVRQNRGVDNRMRIEFIRALGTIGDRRATPALTRVLLTQSETQDFLINRLAAEQMGRIADPESVPSLIQALYLFAPNNPGMRMNDVAGQALVRIGRPALDPLLATLRGENAEANQIAAQYIAAVRQRDAAAAGQMSQQSIVSNEAAFALGQLGFRESIDPLIAETRVGGTGELSPQDAGRVMGASIALVSINRDEADTQKIREALLAAYNRVELPSQMQLLVGMQHFMDPGLLPFFLQKAGRPRSAEDEIPDQRILAYRAYAFLANGDEIAALRQLQGAEPEGITRDAWADFDPIVASTTECNAELACWIRKLADSNALVARKAAYMVARYGRGNPEAINALVGQLGNADEEVRGEVLYALDYAASNGSPEAIARIDELAQQEQGRAIWSHTESLARAIQARLQARTSR
ncbi:HEAT repeat domain-containing protein [Sandaracinus amylolyticus]|uniref:HEAT repeat domain-containing protein n=1 Tax=Sandaracinus amylolyticus TaxID=927083 RepID=UPI001F415325|nr:HEAT repeat domain-containing protein [Sandaracinus amylolyticus]UJR79496.1 HEAT repeat protein [Sandaracinus amylolyticus]